MAAKFGMTVNGVSATLGVLRQMEPETYKALRKELVTAALPLAVAVGSMFPNEPLKNWHQTGRKGKSRMPGYSKGRAAKSVKPIAGTGSARGGGQAVLRIQATDGGAQVYDSAGSKSNSNFVHNLDKRLSVKSRQGKTRSRVLYGAVKRNEKLVETAVGVVMFKFEKQTERRLSRGIGGRN